MPPSSPPCHLAGYLPRLTSRLWFRLAWRSVARVSRYATAAGPRYRVRYRTPDRRQTDKRGFKAKRDAEIFAATVEVRKSFGEFIPASADRATVRELAPDWLDRKKQSTAPSNYRMLKSAWRVHVATKWSNHRVADIDVIGIESWVAETVRNGHGATTVLRSHGVLSGVLVDAVKAKRLAATPQRCRGPAAEDSEGVFISTPTTLNAWPTSPANIAPSSSNSRTRASGGARRSH